MKSDKEAQDPSPALATRQEDSGLQNGDPLGIQKNKTQSFHAARAAIMVKRSPCQEQFNPRLTSCAIAASGHWDSYGWTMAGTTSD